MSGSRALRVSGARSRCCRSDHPDLETCRGRNVDTYGIGSGRSATRFRSSGEPPSGTRIMSPMSTNRWVSGLVATRGHRRTGWRCELRLALIALGGVVVVGCSSPPPLGAGPSSSAGITAAASSDLRELQPDDPQLDGCSSRHSDRRGAESHLSRIAPALPIEAGGADPDGAI